MFTFDPNHGIYNFVERMVDPGGLQEGRDFIVVSRLVMTEVYEIMSAETFHRSGLAGTIEFLELGPTLFPSQIDDNFVFYKLNEEIDVGLATDVGLGVVQMLTGEYAGEKLLYYPQYGNLPEWDFFDEVTAIKVYLQLKHPEICFDTLERLVDQHVDLVMTLMVHQPRLQIQRLLAIFRRHKGLPPLN